MDLLTKLKKITEHVYCLSLPTNIGILAFPDTKGQTKIYLIDSGNDDFSGKQILDVLNRAFSNPKLIAVLNTHSHADHCGGNIYLRNQTGCEIWASHGESALMECPDLETGLIWGGNPVKELKTTYFVAPRCIVDRSFKNDERLEIENISVQVLPLNGHYLDQTGFIINDSDGKKVCFAGDALSGRNVIKKYWIQYLLDEKLTKDSLQRLSQVEADYFVPGHGQGVEAVDGLVELNLLALLETENMILDELKTPKTAEQILKAVADRNNIPMGLNQFVLIGCTLRSYLSALCDEGRIQYSFQDNMMFWSRK